MNGIWKNRTQEHSMYYAQRRIFAPVLLLFFLRVFSFGIDIDNWKCADIYGGQIWSLAMSPSNHNILLAGGIKAVYRSIDQAKTWQKGTVKELIHKVLFAPSNPNIAYVVGLGTLYRSTDSGETWSQVSSNIPLDDLACDPSDENTLYGSNNQSVPAQVYKTTNAGANWNQIYSLPSGFTPSQIAVVTSNVIIVTAHKNFDGDGAIFRSGDAGAIWTQIPALDPDPANCPVYSLAIDPANSDNIYAGGRKYFFKSTNMGATWTPVDVSGTLGSAGSRTIMLTVKSGSELLAYNGLYLYKSLNSGDTWSQLGKIDPTALAGAGGFGDLIYDSTGGILYLPDAYGSGIYKSTDCAVFESVNENIRGVRFTYITHSHIEKNLFYAGSDIDLYRSTDTGNSWVLMKTVNGLRGLGGGDIIVHPSSSNVVYACQSSTRMAGTSDPGGPLVCKSTDYGDTWQRIYQFPDNMGPVLKFAFDPANPDIMYAGTGGCMMSPMASDGFYRSVDGGVNWQRIAFDNCVVSQVVVDTGNPNIIYIAKGLFSLQPGPGTTGVYKSVNGGNNWDKLSIPDDIATGMMLDPDNTNIIYATMKSQGLYKSIDAGNTWNNLFSPGEGLSAFAVTNSTDGQKVLFAATTIGKIYISIDDGNYWQLYTGGFDAINVLCPGSLYAGTESGLYSIDVSLLGLGSGPSDTIKIKVYPNPFNPKLGGNITFDKLSATGQTTIRIYAVTGELVKEIVENDGDGKATWNGLNSAGNIIGRGVYTVLIDGPLGKKKIKIAIEK